MFICKQIELNLYMLVEIKSPYNNSGCITYANQIYTSYKGKILKKYMDLIA